MNKDNKVDKIMQEMKDKFFLNEEKIIYIHQKYIKEFNIAYKKNKATNPKAFIDAILAFMLENEFDANFIRAIFNKPSQLKPIYREELNEFRNIFVTKMLNK